MTVSIHFAAAALAAVAVSLLVNRPARAVDFDCARARSACEQAICADPALSRLDARMARMYGWLWTSLDEGERTALRSAQRQFLAQRDGCGSNGDCLKAFYRARIDVLAGALKRLTIGHTTSSG